MIISQYSIEPIDCLTELERMHQRHRTIELFLRHPVARGRKIHCTEPFATHGMLMVLGSPATGGKDQDAEGKNSRTQHCSPSVLPSADYSAASTLSCDRIYLAIEQHFVKPDVLGIRFRLNTR